MDSNHQNFFRMEKVTDYLEALIDPFDLDVFTPHLNSNLNRLVHRTSVSEIYTQYRQSTTGPDCQINLHQQFRLGGRVKRRLQYKSLV